MGGAEKGVLVIFHVYSCYADFFFATSSSHTCIIIPYAGPTLLVGRLGTMYDSKGSQQFVGQNPYLDQCEKIVDNVSVGAVWR